MDCNEAYELMIAPGNGRSDLESADLADHLKACAACKEIALVSRVRQELVSSPGNERVAVPPFFAAKVMAAINERRNAPDEWTWIWQIARRMVPATFALLVVVAVLSFGFSPNGNQQQPPPDSALISFSSEYNNSLVGTDGTDGQSSILTSTGDLPADRVLSTVMGVGGRTNNE
jgi:hypothetical protein